MDEAPTTSTRAVNTVRLASTEPVSESRPDAVVLAHHALWNSGSLVVQIGSTFALTALAFRQLPASEVGMFALVAVTVGILQILDPAAGLVMARVVAERAGGQRFDARVLPEVGAGLRTVAYSLGGVAVLGLGLAAALETQGPDTGHLVMIAGVVLATCVQLATASLPATALGLAKYRSLFEASAVNGAVSLTSAWLLLKPIGVAALGVAILAGQVASRGLLRIRRPDEANAFRATDAPLGLEAVRSLCRHAGAIYLSSLAAQLLSFSDLWTVGAFKGTGSTATYRAGSIIPTQAAALFYRVYDVLYPRLPRMHEPIDQERAIALGTRVFCAAAGCLFTGVFLERAQLIQLLVGEPDRLAEHVLSVFCAIWLVNVPAHGIALLLISRAQVRVLTPVVLIEAAVNIVLSIVLVMAIGAIGAAVGTFITMAISNLVAIPWITKRLVPGAVRLTWIGAGCCGLGVVVGAALQAPAALTLSGTTQFFAVAALGLVSLIPAVWLSAGRHGRQSLRAHV